jgi:dCMP deaminase
MNIAHEAAKRANCLRRRVGALIVRDHIIVSTGYNGTPIGVRNCFDGGCLRCQSNAAPGEGYDTCICVHAEENAIVLAARHGASTNGSVLYSTLRPCFSCVKLCIQAGIKEVIYEEDFCYVPELEKTYAALIREADLDMRKYVPPIPRESST